jgi:hypothetical protein
MDAPWPVREVVWRPADVLVARRLLHTAALLCFSLVALAGLLVVARRLSGALTEPLPAIVLVTVALALVSAAIAFRGWISRDIGAARPLVRYGASAVPSIVLAVWAAALLLPGTNVAGVLGFLGLLFVEEAWSWRRSLVGYRASAKFDPAGASDTQLSGLSHSSTATKSSMTVPAAAEEIVGATILDHPAADPLDRLPVDVGADASQWIVRRRDEAGSETIEGWVRAPFAASQRHANAHLAICPPFARTPVCYAEQSDGPPAEIKIAQVLPYGVRIEIKLDEAAAEPCDVTIDFSIQEPPA